MSDWNAQLATAPTAGLPLQSGCMERSTTKLENRRTSIVVPTYDYGRTRCTHWTLKIANTSTITWNALEKIKIYVGGLWPFIRAIGRINHYQRSSFRRESPGAQQTHASRDTVFPAYQVALCLISQKEHHFDRTISSVSFTLQGNIIPRAKIRILRVELNSILLHCSEIPRVKD